MFYTSYFAKIKAIKEKYPNMLLVSISHDKPKFLENDETIENWGILGPIRSLLNDYKSGKCDEAEYTQRYNLYLHKMWPSIQTIFYQKYYQSIDVVMLCYEKPDAFCHRHLLAHFLHDHEIPCEELDV